MITKEKKEMEYEEAPSGYVTLYNYKEPFMRYEEGYGFQGVLMFNGEDDKVQCHICGEWFEYLPNHLHREHTTTAAEYKEMVGLAPTTALLGEKQRAVLIQNGTERFKNLRPGIKKTDAQKKKISDSLRNLNRERQNLRGTCPEQLIERIRQTYHKLGRTPKENEIRGKETINRVFGSWKAACEVAGIPYRVPGFAMTHKKSKIVESELLLWVRDYVSTSGELPKQVTYARIIGVASQTISAWAMRHGGWKEVCHKALVSDGVYRKMNGFRYSQEDLLEFLRAFEKNHGRKPAISDCKRGLLPYPGRYIYYWKSWKNALKAAGL